MKSQKQSAEKKSETNKDHVEESKEEKLQDSQENILKKRVTPPNSVQQLYWETTENIIMVSELRDFKDGYHCRLEGCDPLQ